MIHVLVQSVLRWRLHRLTLSLKIQDSDACLRLCATQRTSREFPLPTSLVVIIIVTAILMTRSRKSNRVCPVSLSLLALVKMHGELVDLVGITHINSVKVSKSVCVFHGDIPDCASGRSPEFRLNYNSGRHDHIPPAREPYNIHREPYDRYTPAYPHRGRKPYRGRRYGRDWLTFTIHILLVNPFMPVRWWFIRRGRRRPNRILKPWYDADINNEGMRRETSSSLTVYRVLKTKHSASQSFYAG